MASVPEQSKGVGTLVSELWQLIVAYLKQETIEPIKKLGRYVAFGVVGSLCLSIGLVMLLLAGLRALEAETRMTGNWSWAPYLITMVGCGVVAALAARAISANRRKGPA